ncbi:hypothetical protein [Streptomyces qinglanensis]|uniref:hypothetical protein n=1 Tax=Streptomyces qinglanensis TaxID=943816 RepID=UPI003D7278DB
MGTKKDPLLNDREIAAWFRVNYSTVGKWRVGQSQAAARARRKPAFKAVAETLGVSLPDQAAVPRSLVLAFGKAVGYLNEQGEIIPEVQELSRRWQPIYPTIDPVSREDGKPRLRLYSKHVCARYGISNAWLDVLKANDEEFPASQTDELGRVFWYEEQLEAWDEVLDRRRREKEAGPAPHGYDSQGRPYRYLSRVTEVADGVESSTGRAYRLLPADSYWASYRPHNAASKDS